MTSALTRTKEHSTWRAMRFRCRTGGKDREEYLNRGITVCARWEVFTNFLADMGKAPGPEYTIERINNDGPYEPDNCVWATRKQQARNRRTTRLVEVEGRKVSMAEAAEITGLPITVLKHRLRRGWSDEEAVTRPRRAYPKLSPRVQAPAPPGLEQGE